MGAMEVQYRLSQAKADELSAAKPSRMAKAEGLNLHALLVDSPPELSIENGSMGMHALRQTFETFSYAMAMVELAHLATMKHYYLRFINLMTTKMDSETGLRNPTILEAQSADKSLMTIACDLVMEKGWNFDDAIHEITFIWAEINTLLQPRPRLPKQTYQRLESNSSKGTGKNFRSTPYSKGKGKSQGKSGGKTPGKTTCITEMLVNGNKRQLCMRFQSGKCDMGSNCRFHHACAFPTSSGEACGMAADTTIQFSPDEGAFCPSDFTDAFPSEPPTFSGAVLDLPNHAEAAVTGNVSLKLPNPASTPIDVHAGQSTSLPTVPMDDDTISNEIPMDGSHSCAAPSVPPSLQSPPLPGTDNLHGLRIFLDICCGVNAPLSTAVHNFQGDTMKFDILVHTTDNLLDSECFEHLLRLCSSGIVAYSAASPSCCEYSRLKFLPYGPPALRTPQHLDGVPGLSGENLQKVQESAIMLERCIICIQVTISSGGHGHLEQPKSAMSWEEPVVQQFIKQHSCSCISMAACGFGKDWHKYWMFASSFIPLEELACECPHPPGSHQQIAGVKTPTGQYLSRETVEYPSSLASQFAQIILPLLSHQSLDLDLQSFPQYLPIKGIQSPPFSGQDGAGFPSQADWSGTHSFEDCYRILRKNFFSEQLWTTRWINKSSKLFAPAR